MTKRMQVLYVFAIGIIGCAESGAAPPSQDGSKDQVAGPGAAVRTICDPVAHKGLSVFLVRGPDVIPGKKYLTLQEALDKKVVVVHETGQVNELSIENLGDEDVFIQGGEIVRGGKQDRMIGTDFIVEAHSGRVPIPSFCVEQGRWQQRGRESAARFGSSARYAPSNGIKIAAKADYDQSAVWKGVAYAQQQLSKSLGRSVAAPESASSLELTLDNESIARGKAEYLKSLSNLAADKPDAIGAVIVLNGKIYSADVYGSHELFAKLWPKLIDACAVEAVAKAKEASAGPVPTRAEVEKFLDATSSGKAVRRNVTKRVAVTVDDLAEHMRFETFDAARKDSCVHLNCLRKEKAGGVSRD